MRALARLWSNALARCLALTLALRLVFVLRFGGDASWANAVYLAHAKSLALGRPHLWGPPLPLLAIRAARALGLSALGSLEAIYLVAHLVYAGAMLALARRIWPQMTATRATAVAVLSACLPMIAGDPGYGDIGALVGAALFTAAFALALRCAAGARAGSFALLAACAIAAGASRTEAVAGLLGVAAALAVFRRVELRAARAVALTLVGCAGCALVATAAAHRAWVGRFELAAPTYPFYTFFAGLPTPLCRAPCETEYQLYRESMARFGSFVENHGSLLAALAHHPGQAALRVAAKLFEWARELAYPNGVGPVALALAAVGMVAPRRTPGPARARLLAAYLAPFAVLLAPPVVPMYALSCLPPLVFAIAAGAERLVDRRRAAGWIALSLALAAGAGCAAWFGHLHRFESPLSARVAADLEQRCAAGCLANALPQHVAAEAWVDLEAGAPLPEKNHTDEAFVLGRIPDQFARACRFEGRVARARAAGFAGPVLYLRVDTPSARSYSDAGFDPEHDLEGAVDLARATLARDFTSGPDRLELWSFPPGALP